jgi:hypothetical protein
VGDRLCGSYGGREEKSLSLFREKQSFREKLKLRWEGRGDLPR